MLKKLDTVLDWFFIFGSPLIAWAFWSTENASMLRMLAFLWLGLCVLEAVRDRATAAISRADHGTPT